MTIADKTSSKNIFIAPTKIIVKSDSLQGNGVFATVDIAEGDLIERCPMVQLGYRSNYHHDPIIWKYCYTQPKCDCADCKNHGFYIWMVLGYGMVYNHQDLPTTKWVFNYKEAYADVVASTNITKDSEIFVSYGPKYFQNRQKITIPEVAPAIIVPEEDDETFMARITELMKTTEAI